MRTPNLGTAGYAPGNLPTDGIESLQRALTEEFSKIANVIRLLAAGHIDISYAAPTKPRDGDIRYADGSTWNPGSGKGIYYYKASGPAWVLLG